MNVQSENENAHKKEMMNKVIFTVMALGANATKVSQGEACD